MTLDDADDGIDRRGRDGVVSLGAVDVGEHIEALVAAGEGMAHAAERAGPDAPVPTCPGWVVRDLVQHTSGVHRWATRYVRDAEREPIDDDLEKVSGGWPADGDLVDWFRDGHAALVAALRSAPPDLECFTFLRAPSPLAMWSRRQAHETAVHRVDAEAAAGITATPPTDLALDGIDELLTCFAPRRKTGFRLDPARTLVVRPDDGDRRWDVEIGPERITTTVHPTADTATEAAADATIAGPAAALYLWLWNRASADPLTTSGDPTLLTAWTTHVKVTWS
jgi:uncharacterized protein (TIGR03083 family)